VMGAGSSARPEAGRDAAANTAAMHAKRATVVQGEGRPKSRTS